MADENLTEIKVLLEKIIGEINLSEEKISNKIERIEFLEKTQKLKDELYRAIRNVDKRVTGLYIKVIGAASAVSTAVAVAARFL